jgi:hypothetical protein
MGVASTKEELLWGVTAFESAGIVCAGLPSDEEAI